MLRAEVKQWFTVRSLRELERVAPEVTATGDRIARHCEKLRGSVLLQF